LVTRIEEDLLANIDGSGENSSGTNTTPESAKKPEVAYAPGSSGKPRSRRLILAALGGLLAIVAAFIIIKVYRKDGSVTELKVPDDSKLELAK